METNMINTTNFRITGRIGSINILNKVTHISISSDRRIKDKDGNWTTQANWNSVTVFSNKLRKRLDEANVARHGNLIAIEGSILSNAFEKDGEKQYTTSLVAQDFGVLSFAKQTD